MITLKNIESCIKNKRSSLKKSILENFLKENKIPLPTAKYKVLDLCNLIKKNEHLLKKKTTKKQLLKQCSEKGIKCPAKMKVQDIRKLLQEKKNGKNIDNMKLNQLKLFCKKNNLKKYSKYTRKKDLLKFINDTFNLNTVDLNQWTLLKTPPDGDCGFHAISLAMRIFYKNNFPFLTDNERENVKILRKITTEAISNEIQKIQQKLQQFENSVVSALEKTLQNNDNYKTILQDIVIKKNIPYNILTSLRGELFTLEKIKERKNSLQLNPKEWLQDNDLIYLKDALNVCFGICERNVGANYTLWSAQVPKSCSGDGEYVSDCIQKVPIIYIISEYSQEVGQDINIYANTAGTHYDLLIPDSKSIYTYGKNITEKTKINLDDITISKVEEDETSTDYGMTKIYRAEFNHQSQSNLFQFQKSTSVSGTNSTKSNTSKSQTESSSKTNSSKKQTQVKLPQEKPIEVKVNKPTFCSQQQIFNSHVLSKEEIRQKIKKIFV